METLYKLEDMIRPALRIYKSTRDSDEKLAVYIYHRYYGVPYDAPFKAVLLDYNLPSIESISRVRRKIQAEDESLRGSKRKEKQRMDAQVDYIEYVLSEE